MWHDKPSYGHPSYDPVWAACAEAGLVVHTHSGEADMPSYNENMAQFMLEVAFWTHRALWQLLLAGKFDQFPTSGTCRSSAGPGGWATSCSRPT